MTPRLPARAFRAMTIRPIEPDERFARWSLATLGAVHLVLALSLIFVLATVGQAFAEETPADECRGENLIEAIRQQDPERYETIVEEAEATPNGDALLWRIRREGVPDSWLFGTMHVADPRVTSLPDTAAEAFEEASTVVIETDEIMDPEAAQAAILSEPELTMFTDGRTLQSLMDEADFALLAERLEERGLPVGAVKAMKPWMVAGLVALSPCELERKSDGVAFLDRKIAEDALAAGKTLEGLETVREQLEAMAGLPMELHIKGLVETVSLGPLLSDVMTTMTELYLDGEIGMIMPMIREATPAGSSLDTEGYAAFEERIVLARNRVMAERAGPILEEGDAFIAVGALHLPGEEGLVALLREDGYEVTAAD